MNTNSTSPTSSLDAGERSRILTILESNWQAERRGHHTYERLAEREADPARRAAFRSLAYGENHHADLWAGRIRALGGTEPKYKGPITGDADAIANRIGGVGVALQRLELDESHDIASTLNRSKSSATNPASKS